MEAAVSGTGQSSYSERFDHPRDFDTRTSFPKNANSISSSKATATLISPNTPYYPHHQSATSYPGSNSSYHSAQPQQHQSAPGMISPVESRRTSDDQDQQHRQSLPSIQEVIGKGPSGPYPISAPPVTNIPQQSLPSPFSSTPTRSFPSDVTAERQPSPHSLHHSASSSSLYGSRPDTYQPRSQFSSRAPATGAQPSPPLSLEQQPTQSPGVPSHHLQTSQSQVPPPQPLHPQSYQQYPYPPYPQQRDRESRENPPHLSTYSSYEARQQHPYTPQHQQQQQQQQPPPQPQQLPLPPAHTPLSGSYPASPRHTAPSSLPSPYETQHVQPAPENSPDYGRMRPSHYDQAVHRHFEAWDYAEYLSRIASNSRTIYNFAEAFSGLIRDEHNPQPMLTRMPSDRDVAEMINNADWLKGMLENLIVIVQQSASNDRGAPSGSRQKATPYDDADSQMYGDASGKPYALSEVKKRRGRAAPPGRCHSCNRIDTPEWRRGPDGARTLCNACGLHYAKLERKKQLESRALRPNERI